MIVASIERISSILAIVDREPVGAIIAPRSTAASKALQKPMKGPKLKAMTTRSLEASAAESRTYCHVSIHQSQSLAVSRTISGRPRVPEVR